MRIHTHKASMHTQMLSLLALITPNILCTFLFSPNWQPIILSNFKYCIQTAPQYMHTFQISHDAFFSQRYFFFFFSFHYFIDTLLLYYCQLCMKTLLEISKAFVKVLVEKMR